MWVEVINLSREQERSTCTGTRPQDGVQVEASGVCTLPGGDATAKEPTGRKDGHQSPRWGAS